MSQRGEKWRILVLRGHGVKTCVRETRLLSGKMWCDHMKEAALAEGGSVSNSVTVADVGWVGA